MEKTPIQPTLSSSARIRILPEETASRIAAGEVVERPASALKELLENSLDAQATRLDIHVQGAGKNLIRVADDGCGMTPEECRLALMRHATSKIRSLEDLFSVRSYGFRGEALPAIAAVSRLTLTSTVRGQPHGHRIDIHGGKTAEEKECPAIPGTIMEVRDLFHNTPARLKFLKSDPVERSHLTRCVEETALTHQGLALSYELEGKEVLPLGPARATDPMEALLERIRLILGSEISDSLLAVDPPAGPAGVHLYGYVSKTDKMRASRSTQYWFVNKRPIASRTLQHALYHAYEQEGGARGHPACILFLDLDPKMTDVNVHPAKREVRFKNESQVHDYLSQMLRNILRVTRPIPFLTQPVPEAAVPAEAKSAPYKSESSDVPHAAEPQGLQLYGEDLPQSGWYVPPLRFLGQIESAYLILETQGGILVVDQHAAAERVLYEKFLEQASSGPVLTQALLIPHTRECSASEMQRAEEAVPWLKDLGFEMERFGPKTLLVKSVPALFQDAAADLEGLVGSVLEALGTPPSLSENRKEILAQKACKAAVKAHQPLSEREVFQLLKDLARCRQSGFCPHGRPTLLHLSRAELARRFGRSGPP